MTLETSNKIDAQSFKREPPVPIPMLIHNFSSTTCSSSCESERENSVLP